VKKPPIHLAFAVVLAAAFLGAVLPPAGKPAAPPPAGGPAAPPPAVQLVETVPVESHLGNPALPQAHEVWLDMIRGARERLDLEQFYVSTWPGEPLEDVLAAIGEAAKRGVRVRLLLDARMRATYPEPADSLGRLPGIQVRWIFMGPIAGGVQHSKYFLVDDREVFLGSQNFDWRALKHIHELGVRVRDARVTAAFREVFDLDWQAAGEQMAGRDSSAAGIKAGMSRGPRGVYPLHLVQAPGDTVDLWPSYTPKSFIPDTTRWDLDAIVRLLDAARHEAVVQLLSYSPKERNEQDEAIDAALRRAAERGVKVRLLISDWEADGPRIRTLQSLSQVPNVEARLSTVPEWSGGYIPYGRVEHCKYLVVDSLWTWVGTSNWEPGYFHGSRNLAVTTRNRPLAIQARGIFETSWVAPGAAPVRADSTYAPKAHGMAPPPGKQVYGR
jgi:phosphatidylserine/phosphatidylglycerophosphate/cardiolipin synthase-like enzyme